VVGEYRLSYAAEELLLRLCQGRNRTVARAPVQLAGSSSSVHRQFFTSQLQAAEHDRRVRMDMILVINRPSLQPWLVPTSDILQ
jgi:hypothetical protein